MAAIVRWEPFRELTSLGKGLELGLDWWDPYFYRNLWGNGQDLLLDAYYNDSALVLKGSLAGVRPEDVEVTLNGDVLTIKGESKQEADTKREGYLYRERRYGSFSRSLTLPGGLQADKAEASFEDGVLTLSIPKTEEAKPKQVKVKTKGAIETPKKAAKKKKS